MPNLEQNKQTINIVFEVGPVTQFIIVQILLVTLKLTNFLNWSWTKVFIPLWIVLLIISSAAVLGLLYWATSTFIFQRKRDI